MITINQEKCSGCGLCVEICHESCLTLMDGTLQLERVLCSTCSQCVAVCPRQAVAWDEQPPLAFDRHRLPTPEQLDELFKERRSIRLFKKDKIDRSLLEEIAGYGAYAPTNNFGLRVIIVDNDDLIASLDQTVLDNCRMIYRLAYRSKLAGILADVFGYSGEFNKARPKVEAALRLGHAFHSMPTAFIFIVGDKKVPLSEASAQYALANMMFYAQIKGVGACLWGNAPIFVDKNRIARRQLGLEKHERIFGALYMGYPAIKFHNKVSGKALKLQWNGI